MMWALRVRRAAAKRGIGHGTGLGTVVAALAVTLAVLPAAAHARFIDTTGNGTNTLAAAALAAPSGLSLATTCGTANGFPNFRAMTTTSSSAAALGANTPAGIHVGDVLLVAISWNPSSSTNTITPPSGWTTLEAKVYNTNIAFSLYYKVAGASEPASYTFTQSNSNQAALAILAYAGVNPANILELPTSSNGTMAKSITAPSVNATTTRNAVVILWAMNDGGSITPNGTVTNRVPTFNTNARAALRVDEKSAAATGATGTETATLTTNELSIGSQVVLPGAGFTTVRGTWTASSSTWATGYRFTRAQGGTTQATATVAGAGTTTAADSGVADGTYTYAVYAYRGQWVSPSSTATTTVSC